MAFPTVPNSRLVSPTQYELWQIFPTLVLCCLHEPLHHPVPHSILEPQIEPPLIRRNHARVDVYALQAKQAPKIVREIE
jgi:hypothetical protein